MLFFLLLFRRCGTSGTSAGYTDKQKDLFIDPAVRSKGYGKAMIEAVAEHAKELGCSRLQWVTKHDNPARKMYDKVGTSDFVQYRMAFS